jgi:hypothetical protein
MSGHLILKQATREIRRTLFSAFRANASVKRLMNITDQATDADARTWISLTPPPDKDGATDKWLYLWLYFVSENEHAKNRPATFAPDGTLTPPPLALSLYYLVTPYSGTIEDADAAHAATEEILGSVLEAFHNRPIIPLEIPPSDLPEAEPAAAEELHICLCRLSLEELTRIWDALDRPYRLSVCFKVNVVRIASSRVTRGAPVREREFVQGRLVMGIA